MKKIFILVSSNDLKKYIYIQNRFLDFLIKNFDKVVIVNFKKFELISKNSKPNLKKIKKKIQIYNPKSLNDLKKYFDPVNNVGILNIPINFKNYLILRILKKFNFKLILYQNLGDFGNFENKIKNTLSFSLKKKFCNFIYKILSIIKYFPIIEVYFEARKKILKSYKNSYFIKLNKKINFLELKKFKKVVQINPRDFFLNKRKNKQLNDKIVFLDSNFFHQDRIDREGPINLNQEIRYFNSVRKILNIIANEFKKEIVICLHPTSNYEIYKKYFGNFKIVQFNSHKIMDKAFLVIAHETSLIINAMFLKKKILLLKTKDLGKYNSDRIYTYIKNANLRFIDLDKKNFYKLKNIKTYINGINDNYKNFYKKNYNFKSERKNDEVILSEINKLF
jgi:hypothetical protein